MGCRLGRYVVLEDQTFIKPVNQALHKVFWEVLRISRRQPLQGLFVLTMLCRQWSATRRRQQWLKRGIHVPPYLIASVTERCNLKCKGCYAQAHIRPAAENSELSLEDWSKILNESDAMGISVAILAGGEPLTRVGLIDLIQSFSKTVFLLFTNGLLVDENVLNKLMRKKNVVPVVSLEGPAHETDARRGGGVFGKIRDVLRQFHRLGIFYGVSMTVTRENITKVTDSTFIESLVNDGCRLFFFIEYVPVKEGTDELVLTDDQVKELGIIAQHLNHQFKSLFIVFPGDEKYFGGCLAAGRGFIHINSTGGLEPCPFAPFSDVNLKDVSLQDALQSKFLQAIREDHGKLTETQGGCALWTHRDWVGETLKKTLE